MTAIESIAQRNIYRPVFEKYGIFTQYDRIHWVYRDDSEQIRKDLLEAFLADEAKHVYKGAVALRPHHHDD